MINICEVGPRDGLQNEKKFISTENKIKLIKKCIDAGVKKIEVVSFVNPKVVPQMADAEAIVDALPKNDKVDYAGLVLSRSGLIRALNSKIKTLHVVMATSDGFNQKNAKRSVQESLNELTDVLRDARKTKKNLVGVLGTAFGCPFDGTISPEHVLSIAETFLENGCTEITLADTTGYANPRQVQHMVELFYKRFGKNTPLGLHFHNTRGLGLANVYAGYQSGVRKFDSSIAGLGGCPFAPKAVGNVCTEDMINMFHEMNEDTEINLESLVETAKWTENQIGRRLDGMLMKVNG